ncbi:hypothetical protein LTR10_021646 [Elasticomyces elasticus]|uniref:Uncharacterized protein n=1 Tax=Exophiala sideris TaxID=1016849 RepID=A0ABR0J9C0_9EURO|nr:hypothetical protein LTR10_021646 [Elasticomyces elasticus]KAK5022207.1 hypothetical protein LTS07_010287 [Exophiala sideris]KAK5037351.1 hypothetical protein LTR13_004507 [Exophiala sideris]KAK5059015.1 hypothetical protein LTR69_006302 [Exophiala sideris]KAK5182847.1 hypothetical protein LTR44_004555 [Eurotiomycetes sp. CCFEE 6388]
MFGLGVGLEEEDEVERVVVVEGVTVVMTVRVEEGDDMIVVLERVEDPVELLVLMLLEVVGGRMVVLFEEVLMTLVVKPLDLVADVEMLAVFMVDSPEVVFMPVVMLDVSVEDAGNEPDEEKVKTPEVETLLVVEEPVEKLDKGRELVAVEAFELEELEVVKTGAELLLDVVDVVMCAVVDARLEDDVNPNVVVLEFVQVVEVGKVLVEAVEEVVSLVMVAETFRLVVSADVTGAKVVDGIVE